MPGSTTAAGSTLAISAGTPSAQTAAAFAALAFTVIGGLDKIGPVPSATFAKVEFQPLVGGKDKLKGSADYGSMAPSAAYDDADAGQTLLRAAAADETQKLYSFKTTYPNGTVVYAQGRVFSAPDTIEGADSVLMTNADIGITTKPIKA
ncbi:MAG: hypothetical protein PGN16_08380 [Sphingomonas phyllosphaerae]|uniref:hypothetical protein n=1 Tax=Sphingomonas phyllosphaerae TaxID=257003 RepID=UPI002FFCD78B